MYPDAEGSFRREMRKLCFTPQEKRQLCSRLTRAAAQADERMVVDMIKRRNFIVVALAVAILMSMGFTVLAVTTSGVLHASSSAGYDFIALDEIPSAGELLPEEIRTVKLPETLAGGLRFQGAVIVTVQEEVPEGALVECPCELQLTYEGSEGKRVNLRLKKSATPQEQGSDKEELRYSRDEYLFLPSEETPLEDAVVMRLKEDPHFFVSYGSDEVESAVYQSVNFEYDGLQATLFTTDEIPEAKLTDMARELIER